MITLYEGFPGSGKTYDAVRKIISNISIGRRVLTNIDGMANSVPAEALKHITNYDDQKFKNLLVVLSQEQTKTFWEFSKPGDLIVIDEAQNYFNSRDWNKQENRDFGRWAFEHRHNVQDLILITPSKTRIDSAVRELVEWTYGYKKLNMFGGMLQKKYVRFAYYGVEDTMLKRVTCTYDPYIFLCYQSYFADGSKEKEFQKRPNVLQHPIFYLIPIVFFFFIYFGSKSSLWTGDLFGAKKNLALAEEVRLKSITSKKVPVVDSSNSPDVISDVIIENEPDVFMCIINNKKYFKNSIGEIYVKD
jgi:zona occludens toxin